MITTFYYFKTGFHGPLEVNHKVNTFIIKNPPNVNPANQGASLTESKRSKRSKKSGENGESTETDPSSTDDPVEGSKHLPNDINVCINSIYYCKYQEILFI